MMSDATAVVNPSRRLPNRALAAALICLGVVSFGGQAGAQSPRGFLSINVGEQSGSTNFVDDVVFDLYQEQGTYSAAYSTEGGSIIDVGGGMRFGEKFAIGLAVSMLDDESSAVVGARLPHPLFFNRDRLPPPLMTSGLARDEMAVHIQAMFLIPLNEKMNLALFAGPTWFDVSQVLVTDLRFTEEFPFDTVDRLDGLDTQEQSGTAVGFNVGLDFAYYFSDKVGAGILARLSEGEVDLDSADGERVSVDAGGFQIAVGLRFRIGGQGN